MTFSRCENWTPVGLAGDFPIGAVALGVVFFELAFAVAFLVVPFIWPPSYGKFATSVPLKRIATAD
jgi:hypothetical protein